MEFDSDSLKTLERNLTLYRYAVQHPEAEVNFLERAYMHYFQETRPTLLREDFAGTCAISGAWVELDEDNRALAVEIDKPTAVWADQRLCEDIGERAEDVIILVDDVMNVCEPTVDIVASMNFSTLIYHKHHDLVEYFRHVRKCMEDEGIFVMDIFGGKGAEEIGVQERELELPKHVSMNGCDKHLKYLWEQKSFDAFSQNIHCGIHFRLSNGEFIENAFSYDWRLWPIKDLQAAMIEAGFESAEVWCDEYDEESGMSNGYYMPAKGYPERRDWVAYIVAVKR